MRIFTFGCSFTNYWWPTWADILAHDVGCDYYNFGNSGLGNVGIFSRMVQADNKYNFTPDDKIYVMWSGWHRVDRVNEDGWWTQENNNELLKKDWSMPNYVMKNYVSIISANKMFDITWQGHMSEVEVEDEFNFFNYDIPNIDAYFLNSKYFKKYQNINDSHPCIKSHTAYIENIIGHPVKQSTKDYFFPIHERIKKVDRKEHCYTHENSHKSIISTFWKDHQQPCQWNKLI